MIQKIKLYYYSEKKIFGSPVIAETRRWLEATMRLLIRNIRLPQTDI